MNRLRSTFPRFVAPSALLIVLQLFPVISPASPAPSAAAPAEIEEPPITARDLRHWSFAPLNRVREPSIQNRQQARNPIDRFILARLEGKGLRLSPEAHRETLIRRLSFDLTGLPPTPDEVRSFLADPSPHAYESLVDRLLADDAYGERWAQHWLDVARFAESDGFEHDKVRKEAWRYRDWVIQALNADMPYDQFIQWQIAGDELNPSDPDATLATGFLVSGPDMPDVNLKAERRHTVLNEITSTVGAALLGLGVGCAQCHDHKYDPISQADFYRFRSFFSNMALPPKDESLRHHFSEQGGQAPASHLMVRGDFRRPGALIEPGYLRIVSTPEDRIEARPVGSTSSGRRSELARWLTRQDHPLTLRVIANRLWLHHFNQPLVGTPNDFGTQGRAPTHPQLLDWLATELPRANWSLKSIHKLLVTSATYRQASSGDDTEWARKLEVDPTNELLSRMNRRRLSGETVRDAMLLISNQLNRRKGGPGFRPPLPPEITVTLLNNQWPVTKDKTEHHRRSIYLFARRNLRYPMFEVFDRPNALASCAQRDHSITAPQSLTLFNSGFSLDRARDLATAILLQPGQTPAQRINEVYLRILSRSATEEEIATGRRFLNSQSLQLRTEQRPTGQLAIARDLPEREDPYLAAALTDYCLALFNLNEFLYVD